MKAILSLLVICLATSVYGNAFRAELEKNIVTDFLGSLGGQIATIAQYFKELSLSTLAQVTAALLKLYNSGAEMITLCMPILNQLAADLQDHAYTSIKDLFEKFVANLNHQLAQGIGKRDADLSRNFFSNIFSSLIGNIGTQFAAIADYFKVLSTQVLGQFTSTVLQMVAQGSEMVNLCKPILAQLLKDLQSHAITSAESLFTIAITNLNQQLTHGLGKRDLNEKGIFDVILNTLGLKELLQKLKEIGTTTAAAFTATVSQALLIGGNLWTTVLAVLKQLQSDLLEHTNTASVLFNNALTTMHFLISQNGKRELAERSLLDTILGFFGNIAGPVIQQVKDILQKIREHGGTLYNSLVSLIGTAASLGQSSLQMVIQEILNLGPHLNEPWETVQAMIQNTIATLTFTLQQGY